MPPRVSVLVPTYNYARYLPEALDSVLAQQFTDFELIISDDASTDNSAEILRRYAARDARIRYQVHPKNLGMVANWNWCLNEARGEYIKYLFGDDRLSSPLALGTLVTMLEKNPAAVLAVSARNIIDEQSRIVDCWDQLGESGVHSGRAVGRRCLLRAVNYVGEPSVVLFRASQATRGFDTSYRQIVDLEMWCHLLRGGDLVYTREPLCQFRCHAVQQTAVNRQQQRGEKEYPLLFAEHMDYFLPAGAAFPPEELNHVFLRVFHMRRDLRSNLRHDITPEAKTITELLMSRLGRGRYFRLWLRRRLTRPFLNFWRFWHKHVLHRPLPPCCAS
ncbi:MAG: glycosyltransferase family 2 protein [Opitutae bacterium]|nr:glycosyltransferase family 2 protein [Opitutae bacterium]